jgi:hypothetical protein
VTVRSKQEAHISQMNLGFRHGIWHGICAKTLENPALTRIGRLRLAGASG